MRLLFLIGILMCAGLAGSPGRAQEPVMPTLETLQTVRSNFKTTLSEFPRALSMAFVVAEDRDFFENPLSESPLSLHTAALFSEQARPGLDVASGTAREELAVWLGQNTDHFGVLELYLNLAYFGRTAFGIEEASVAYFGKPAAQMRLDEAAYLALLPREPAEFQLPEDGEAVRERFDAIMGALLDSQVISQDEHDMFVAGPLPVVLPPAE